MRGELAGRAVPGSTVCLGEAGRHFTFSFCLLVIPRKEGMWKYFRQVGLWEKIRLVMQASAISLGSGGPREPAGSLGCWAPRFSLRISPAKSGGRTKGIQRPLRGPVQFGKK